MNIKGFLIIFNTLSENSHKRVNVKCDFNTSDKCKNEYTLEYRQYLKFSSNNDGQLSCIYCHNNRYMGRNNPNCKYKNIDDNDKDFLFYLKTELYLTYNLSSYTLRCYPKIFTMISR